MCRMIHTNNVRAIRLQLGLSQAALAVLLDMTQGNVGHYERRSQAVPPEVAQRLIDVAKRRNVAITFDDVYGKRRG